jgi:hypothetical protein
MKNRITNQGVMLPFCIINCTLLFLFGLTGEIRSQNPMGAASAGMGMTGVSGSDPGWAVFNNPALMSTDENTVSFYGLRYAGFAELTDMAAAISLQTPFGTVGAGVHRYGFELFSENRFLAGWKYSIERLHIGTTLTYHHIHQGGGYGSAGALGVDLGIMTEIATVLRFGARATNINQPAYGGSGNDNGVPGEYLPRELAAGLTYTATEALQLSAELVKDVRFPLSFRSGIQIGLIPSLYLRGGFTTRPGTWSTGLGYSFSRFSVNIAMQQHEVLGLSPGMDLTVRF